MNNEWCTGVNEFPAASQHASGVVDLMNPGGSIGVDPVFQTWSDLWNLDLVGDEDEYYNITKVTCLQPEPGCGKDVESMVESCLLLLAMLQHTQHLCSCLKLLLLLLHACSTKAS